MVPVEIVIPVEFDDVLWYNLINVMVDFVFIIDLLVNFNTTFEYDQEVVRDRKRIAK